MERIYELRIDTQSKIREMVAHLLHEMNEANATGEELVCELWKSTHRKMDNPIPNPERQVIHLNS